MQQYIQAVPLTDIAESPFNPRRLFHGPAMAELAESIREQGVLSPVLLRPLDGLSAVVRRFAPSADGWWTMAVGEPTRVLHCGHEMDGGHIGSMRCPLGRPGDRLWVRETWIEMRKEHWGDRGLPREAIYSHPWPRVNAVAYRADTSQDGDEIRAEYGYRWRPSIHMPRWASRITLEISDVRAQRVQEITAEEAVAEGVRCHVCDGPVDGTSENDCACFHTASAAVPSFQSLWRSIYGYESWASNAWVWAVTFKWVQGGDK